MRSRVVEDSTAPANTSSDEPAKKSIRQKITDHREARAEKKYIRKEISKMNLERETPAFVVLDGVDPRSEEPPPYRNIYLMRQAARRQIAEPS